MRPGEKLRLWRLQTEVSQAWLASHVGTAQSVISEIEQGNQLPSWRLAVEIQEVTRDAVTLADWAQDWPLVKQSSRPHRRARTQQ